MRTFQINIPVYHLGITIFLMTTGEIVLSPMPHFEVTFDNDCESSLKCFMDKQGLILSEKDSKEYEYDWNFAYRIHEEPLLKAWIKAQQLELPMM